MCIVLCSPQQCRVKPPSVITYSLACTQLIVNMESDSVNKFLMFM